jgi:UDP-N-acetylglucosamine 2-epimerase (non-hydrolysing)
MRPGIEARGFAKELGLKPGSYGLVTLHRPSNVDEPQRLRLVVDVLTAAARQLPIVFPVHPRTRRRLIDAGLLDPLAEAPGVRLLEPMGYVEFMSLVFQCAAVITDSGGIQEESTYLGIPCMTLRENTERPITVLEGTNRLVRMEEVVACTEKILRGEWPRGRKPDLWDGRTAARVVQSLKEAIG